MRRVGTLVLIAAQMRWNTFELRADATTYASLGPWLGYYLRLPTE